MMRRLFLVALALTLISFGTYAQDKKSGSPPAQDSSASQSLPKGYIGAETCKACHDELYTSFEKTPHWKTTYDTHRGAAFQGCEACHGPGEAHMNDPADKSKIINFKKMDAAKISERCLGCHQYGEEHSNFSRSAHNDNNVSCIDCHSPHHAVQANYLLKKKQPELCYSCHLDTKPQFNKPFHHRVNEGLVKCTDCHNQHGGFLNKQLRSTAAQDMICVKCHTEKAGPFVFEHQPVKIEGCASCHTPHGSSNPRLLKRAQVNLLCLECHTLTIDSAAPGIPSFHNQAQKYQACTMCHAQIHGSNFDKTFFK